MKQRGVLQSWFDPTPLWLAEPSSKRGRAARSTGAALPPCLTLSALFSPPLRQMTEVGDTPAGSRRAGLRGTGLRHLSRRQEDLNVAIPFSAHRTRRRRAGGRTTNTGSTPEPLQGHRNAAPIAKRRTPSCYTALASVQKLSHVINAEHPQLPSSILSHSTINFR
jgi:hypothetical protein